jgi:DNA-binding transcriptional LysR family regulator
VGNDRTGRVEDMIVFARVVEAGSLTRAARGLGTTRSAVSKSISRLEAHLGARLLHRTTRELNPTAAGKACYVHCARIAAETQLAERVVSEIRAAPKGQLRVSCAASVGMLLARELPRFSIRYPGVSLDVELEDQPVDLVREGVDVGIRIGHLPDSSVVGRRLASYRRIICASPAYLHSHSRPRTPKDLAGHNCLFRTGHNQWRFRGGRRSLSVRVRGNYSADTAELLRHAALAGLGITMLPSFVIGEDLAAHRLVPLLPSYALEPSALFAVYANQLHLSPNVRAFVDFLVEVTPRLAG